MIDPSVSGATLINGIPSFVDAARSQSIAMQQSQRSENRFKDFFKRWPKLYDALVWLVGPSYFTGYTSERFVRHFRPAGITLHVGSGTRVLPCQSINLDLFPFPGVDVIADVASLPFRSDAFGAVTCDQVLEHVEHPHLVAREIVRVTASGGFIHVASPFLFPWHPSPSDYTRWTKEGLASLFSECEVVESGIMAGPCSAFVAFMAAFIATAFSGGSRSIQGIVQYIFLILLAPIKFLDILFARLPNADLCAANFYIIVRKR